MPRRAVVIILVVMSVMFFNWTRQSAGEGKQTISEGTKPPVVVKTSPQVFSNDIDPSLSAITATFDQLMMDKSWSWMGAGETYPKTTGEISYDPNKTTCSLPVKL